jgi:hypothetical protein
MGDWTSPPIIYRVEGGIVSILIGEEMIFIGSTLAKRKNANVFMEMLDMKRTLTTTIKDFIVSGKNPMHFRLVPQFGFPAAVSFNQPV